MQIAFGSANELQCHLLIARDLRFISEVNHTALSREVSEVKRMLAAFLKKLRADR
jgi:four helix bundle protein